MNETALGEFLTVVFLRYVPFIGGGVIAAILTIFALFMFEALLIKEKEKSRDLPGNMDRQRPER